MFIIDRTDPTRLTLIGKPQDTLGQFPVSVAYSPKIKTGETLILNHADSQFAS
jgi:hypothetical protein